MMGWLRDDRYSRPAWRRYSAAVLVVLAAAVLSIVAHAWFAPVPLAPYFAAVALAAWYGGVGPAIATMVLALAPITLAALEPLGELRVSRDEEAALVTFVLVATLLVRLSASRDRAERAAQASEARLGALLAQLPVGIGLTDAQGRWLLTNTVLRQFVGETLPSQDPEMRPRWQGWDAHGQALPPAQWPGARALRGETVAGMDFRYTDPSGASLWLRVAAAPFRDATGAIIGVVNVIQDIDAQKRTDEERAAFLDAVAHDLKNPLAAAKGQAELGQRRLQRGEVTPERLEPAFARITTAVDQAAALIDELLDMAHLRSGRPLELHLAAVDLVALVTACVEQARQRSPRHVVRLAAASPTLVGQWDEARLERVVTNLLDNARKYSPDGGQIVVQLGCSFDAAGMPWVTLEVLDQGVGIPAADLPHIFERFRRGRNVGAISGTGIGLAGAQQIVTQHGGTIAIESTEGQGTTVTVRVPLRSHDLSAIS